MGGEHQLHHLARRQRRQLQAPATPQPRDLHRGEICLDTGGHPRRGALDDLEPGVGGGGPEAGVDDVGGTGPAERGGQPTAGGVRVVDGHQPAVTQRRFQLATVLGRQRGHIGDLGASTEPAGVGGEQLRGLNPVADDERPGGELARDVVGGRRSVAARGGGGASPVPGGWGR